MTHDEVDRTVDAGEGRFIDLDDEGTIVAIEILDISQGIQLYDLMDQFDLKPVLDAVGYWLAIRDGRHFANPS
jgi:hypothetical protein